MATSATGQTKGRLFHILDTISHRRFLIDTGAEISLIPPTHKHSPPQDHGFTLLAANGASIPVFGRQSLTLNLGLRRKFQWVFIEADVKQPIIGADFLNHFNLLVDLKHKQLIDSNTRLQVQGSGTSNHQPLHLVWNITSSDNIYYSLLTSFSSLIRLPTFNKPPIHHNVTHRITTVGQPVHSKPRRLPPERLKIAKQEFDHMIQLGIVRPSSSNWASPLHMVPKRMLENGGHVGTTEHSTTSLLQTDTLFHTYKISHLIYMEQQCSLNWI